MNELRTNQGVIIELQVKAKTDLTNNILEDASQYLKGSQLMELNKTLNLVDNNHEPYYNIRDRKKEGNNVLFMVFGKYTSKEIVDRLNEREETIQRLKEIREEQIQTILKQKRKIKELTAQLKTDEEDDICIKCKHHYLINYPESSKYYISKCKKGHNECSKEYIRFCEDFEF